MYRIAPIVVLLLTLAAGSATAAVSSAVPSFALTPEPTAKEQVASSHGFYVVLKGSGWYVGNPSFVTSGVPIVSTEVGYTCGCAAGQNDKGDRTADLIDEHGNTVVTLSGKTLDKDVAKLLAKPTEVIPEMHRQAESAVAKAKRLAKDKPEQAKALLEAVMKMKGWKESDDARALLQTLKG
jgi:hypothetical protein